MPPAQSGSHACCPQPELRSGRLRRRALRAPAGPDLLRPALSLERLSWDETGTVLYRRKARSRFATAPTAFDPMDLLARLLMHIPQPRLHTVRYYGEYSSVVRARRRVQQGGVDAESLAGPDLPSTTERRRLRRAWATLIRRIYEVDPLICRCGARMRILAFIQDPQEVTRILQHIDHKATTQERAPPPSTALAS
jgi:hypothetical protein